MTVAAICWTLTMSPVLCQRGKMKLSLLPQKTRLMTAVIPAFPPMCRNWALEKSVPHPATHLDRDRSGIWAPRPCSYPWTSCLWDTVSNTGNARNCYHRWQSKNHCTGTTKACHVLNFFLNIWKGEKNLKSELRWRVVAARPRAHKPAWTIINSGGQVVSSDSSSSECEPEDEHTQGTARFPRFSLVETHCVSNFLKQVGGVTAEGRSSLKRWNLQSWP